MSQENTTNRNHMTAFREEVLMLNHKEALTSAEESAIKTALANNSAVGIIAGTYDEGLTISFASYYFLKNLGYEYADVSEADVAIKHSFLAMVHEDDRSAFSPDNFRDFSGRFNFRVLTKDGLALYAHAYKTDFPDETGSPQWMLSVRVSFESFDLTLANEAKRAMNEAIHEKDAMNQLVHAMSRLIVRFAICDLKQNSYAFYDCGNGAAYESSGTYTGLLNAMEKRLKPLTDSSSISEYMSAEHLRLQLKAPSDSFKFDYAELDESAYYNMSVVPMEWENGVLTKFVMLAQNITQMKLGEIKAQQALEEACAAANRANQAKTDFLSNMSHDIRTPMNAIIGMTAIAGAHIDQKERVMDSLEKINNASRHLLSLINDLLDMSQIEKGGVTLSEDEFNLSELVDSMIDMIKPEISSHQHNFEVAIVNVEHEHVIGDMLRIQQIFTNIMGNAIKYTPDGGNLRLTISEKPTHHAKIGCYEFIFEDNGIGMSQELQKVIFDPFARGKSDYVKDVQGSGLGMAITKNIVSMMNGDIKVDSTLGKGSKFTVTIFLRLQDTAEDPLNELYDLSVLVVDDDRICCESTVDTLNSIGMVGEWVDNGNDAIAKAVEKHEAADDYFAIILDWKMPQMDGIETARRIRRSIGPDVPIIMLSAYDYSEIETEAREAGIDGFIAKPLFKSRLKNIFRQFVKNEQQGSRDDASLEHIRQSDYSGKRVLIVEDNELNREIAIELIGATGVAIETAKNGKEAVEMVYLADEGYYDMIFMDIQMPIMNGYEATKAIRELDGGKGSKVPIIAMTANAFAEDVIKSKNAGMNDHIAKPISMEKLNEVLENGLR